jgi:Zn ribbon nucleic-acid-binding protein
MEKVIVYRIDGNYYKTRDEAGMAMVENHPELLDDDCADFEHDNMEEVECVKCEFCGRLIIDDDREDDEGDLYTSHILINHPEEQ